VTWDSLVVSFHGDVELGLQELTPYVLEEKCSSYKRTFVAPPATPHNIPKVVVCLLFVLVLFVLYFTLGIQW